MYGMISSVAVERVFKTINKCKNTTLQKKKKPKQTNKQNSRLIDPIFFSAGYTVNTFFLPNISSNQLKNVQYPVDMQ
jgi:hypothetical protein